jgi:hypothetical protein
MAFFGRRFCQELGLPVALKELNPEFTCDLKVPGGCCLFYHRYQIASEDKLMAQKQQCVGAQVAAGTDGTRRLQHSRCKTHSPCSAFVMTQSVFQLSLAHGGAQ